MKYRKIVPVVLVLLGLAAGLGIMGYRKYQEKFVLIDNVKYHKTVQVLDLSDRQLGDLEQLKQLPDLMYLNLRGTGIDGAAYDMICSWFPEAEVFWDIPFQGEFYPMETRELTVTSLTEADLDALRRFTELKTVNALECRDYPILDRLRRERQDLEVVYTLSLAGEEYPVDVQELVIPGTEAETLKNLLPYFTNLQKVELIAPLAPAEQLLTMVEMAPETEFCWNLELAGIPVNEKTETLDLTGIPMTVEEMDAVLPYLMSLTYVDMTDCGISNEEMDALNRRYENIKIVWTVILGGWYRIRTDVTSFMPVKDDFYANGTMLHNLRYCTDMIAIDVGHMRITDIEFVAYMPHLKYLLLCQTAIKDLTPLTGLTELVYLELFLTEVQDLSPLVTLTALEDLNLHYIGGGDPNIIAEMTWLKNLWWNNLDNRKLTYEEQEMLRKAIPDCNFNFTCISSTGGGWRELPNYYAQRDIFGMHYMSG